MPPKAKSTPSPKGKKASPAPEGPSREQLRAMWAASANQQRASNVRLTASLFSLIAATILIIDVLLGARAHCGCALACWQRLQRSECQLVAGSDLGTPQDTSTLYWRRRSLELCLAQQPCYTSLHARAALPARRTARLHATPSLLMFLHSSISCAWTPTCMRRANTTTGGTRRTC